MHKRFCHPLGTLCRCSLALCVCPGALDLDLYESSQTYLGRCSRGLDGTETMTKTIMLIPNLRAELSP